MDPNEHVRRQVRQGRSAGYGDMLEAERDGIDKQPSDLVTTHDGLDSVITTAIKGR
jgi:hypothetical protein